MADTITVMGNIATTPEKRSTTNGVATLNFRMATNHRRQDDNGDWVDVSTNWFEVRAFRALAENAAASLTKGDAVIVTGRLKLREWESKEGRRGLSVEIEADTIGPDLRRGRGVFHRTIPAVAQGETAGADSSGGAPADDAGAVSEAWEAPGAEPVPF